LCDGFSALKLVVAYSSQFAAGFPNQQAIHHYIINLAESFDEVYDNSNISVQIRLVFAFETIHNQFGNRDDDHGHFVLDDTPGLPPIYVGPFDEVFNHMERYRADAKKWIFPASARRSVCWMFRVYPLDGML
jgi:hypothetical protein